MAETLGLAAAIAGLASLAIQVSQISFQYVSGVRHTSKTVSNYLQELSALTSVILRLQNAVEQPEVQDALTSGAFAPPIASFRECTEQMQILKDKLERYMCEPGIRSKVRALSWPLEDRETRHCVEMFHRYCNTFNMIVSADTLVVTATTLQEVRSSKRDDHRRMTLEWLSPCQASKKQAQILRSHHAETVEWLLDAPQYSEWLSRDHSILWCYGNPGVGKTVMTSFVVDSLPTHFDGENVGIAYHYCDFQDGKHQPSTANILRSLLRQMAEKTETLPSEIDDLYEEFKATGRNPEISKLVNAFMVSIKHFSSSIVVIDALDEQQDRKALISVIEDLEAECKILLTSRPLEDIKESMKDCLSLEVVAAESDIKQYVEMRLRTNEDLDFLISPKLRQEIVARIVVITDGVFLLVRLLMDNLDELATVKQIRETLQRMPINLAEAYESTFTRIMQQSPSRARLALRVLSWVMNCKRPLLVEELRHALAVEVGTMELDEENLSPPKIMINSCMGLVIFEGQSNTTRLAHLTVVEFLSQHHQDTLDKTKADLEISRVCLTYLQFKPFHESACHTQEDLAERLHDYAFLDYAACNWGKHISGEVEHDLEQDLLAFLSDDNTFQNAVQVLHYQRRSDRTTPASAFEAIPRGFSNLHVVAYWGLPSATKLLLEERRDVSVKDSHGWAPLHWASARGHEAVVQLLLANGADIESEDRRHWTAIFWAVQRQRENVVSLLIAKGAKTDVRDENGETVLHLAVSLQNIAITTKLLDGGADMDFPDDNGKTPLEAAIQGGNTAIISSFKNFEAASDQSGTSEADLEAAAAAEDHIAFKRVLQTLARPWRRKAVDDFARDRPRLVNRCDLSTLYFFTYGAKELPSFANHVLHRAIVAEKVAVVRCLIYIGADPLVKYRNGQTYLHTATACRNGAVATMLTERSVDPLVADHWGRTALHYATMLGNKAVTDILVRYVAAVNMLDSESQSPMHLIWRPDVKDKSSDMDNRITILETLCANGANINAQNQKGETALHLAVKRQTERPILKLLELGADIALRDDDGKQAIHFLAARDEKEEGSLEILRAFLQKCNSKLSAEDNDGHTALSTTLSRNNWEMASMLFERGGTVPLKHHLNKPLFDAVICRNIMAIRLLYGAGAQPNVPNEEGEPVLVFAIRIFQMALEGESPDIPFSRVSRRAAPSKSSRSMPMDVKNFEAIVRTLLDNGEDVDSQNDNGTTSLQIALRSSKTASIVDILLERAASIDLVNKSGHGAFHAAAESGNLEFIQLLFKLGANCNSRTSKGETPISIAAANGYKSIVELFLDNETLHENYRTEADWLSTAQLNNAIDRNDIDLFHHLQGKQTSIQIQDKEGRTVLHKASSHGNLLIATSLLHLGPDVNNPDSQGWTPLHLAAARGHTDMTHLLAQHGANLTARTNPGKQRTRLEEPGSALALHLASWYGHAFTVRTLLDLSAPSKLKLTRSTSNTSSGEIDIDDGADQVGRTALMCAAQQGHMSIVALLLDAGADVNAVGGYGSWHFCAIDLASSRGHEDIVEYLARRGSEEDWWTCIGAIEAIKRIKGEAS